MADVPVYMIIECSVKEPQMYAEYVEKVKHIVQGFGGVYLVRGGKVLARSGGWDPERVVVIRFLTLDDLNACFASDEYKAVAHLRENSAVMRAVVVEGV